MTRPRRARPWGDYVLRVIACGLLFVSGFLLVSQSTFAMRLREDVPAFVPGLNGVQGLALVLALVLSFLPLVAGRRFLAVFLASSFVLTGIGAYWWTTIPWDELLTESNFTAERAPRPVEIALVMAPVFVAAFYAAVSRASVLRADYLRRGADAHEATRAAAASFLAGATSLVLATLMTAALVAAQSAGLLRGIPGLVGVPAVVAAGLLVVLAYVFGSGSFVVGRKAAEARPEDAEAAPEDAGAKPALKQEKAWG